MGEALEKYIKYAFGGTFGITEELEKIKTFNQEFYWLGSQNNPAKLMDCKLIKFCV